MMDSWATALSASGIDQELLVKKGTPCPVCGGKDRYTYDNKFNHGDSFCRTCGHMDAIDLLMRAKNMDYKSVVAALVESGAPLEAKINHNALNRNYAELDKQKMLDICNAGLPAKGTDVEGYLQGRMLEVPDAIADQIQCYFVPEYERYEKASTSVERHPAMMWKMYPVFANGDEYVIQAHMPSSLHLTRLHGTEKSDLVQQAKVFTKKWLDKHYVYQLAPLTHHDTNLMILAEGVETALSAYQIMRERGLQCSTMAMMNTSNMKTFHPINKWRNNQFLIFADNDTNNAGLIAALQCQANIRKMSGNPHSAKIYIPQTLDMDWNDALINGFDPETLRAMFD